MKSISPWSVLNMLTYLAKI